MPQSPTSQRKRELHAVTLAYNMSGLRGANVLTLKVGPQQTSFSEPARTTARKTLGGFYVDESGPDIKAISLEGHTGFNTGIPYPGAPYMDGYQCFLALRDMHRLYLKTAGANALVKEGKEKPNELRLYLWEEGEYWIVVPNGPEALQRTRNANAPLMFNYRYSLLAVRNMDEAPDQLSTLFAGLPALGAITAAMDTVRNAIDSVTGPITGALAKMRAEVMQARQTVDVARNAASQSIQPLLDLKNEAGGVLQEAAGMLESGQAAAGDAIAASRAARIAFTAGDQGATIINNDNVDPRTLAQSWYQPAGSA